MAFGNVNVGGGIGTTMIISRSHEGMEAPIVAPLQIGYYQNIVTGANIANVSIKQGTTLIPTIKSIVDKDILQLSGFTLFGHTEYSVEIPENAMKDKLGNVLKGAYRYTFTTGTSTKLVYLITPAISKSDFDGAIAEINEFGGTIYFSEGEFRGLFPIVIRHSDVELIGQGNKTKIICDTRNAGGTIGVIGIAGTSAVMVERVKIASMVIDGDYSSDTSNRRYVSILFSETKQCTTKDCILQNNGGGGISMISNAKNNTATGNICCENYLYGISLGNNSNNNIILANKATSINIYGTGNINSQNIIQP